MAWLQRTTIFGDMSGENLGRSVTLNTDGTIIAIASSGYDSSTTLTNAGYLKTYKWNSDLNLYSQIGDTIYGTESNDVLGFGGIDLSSDGTTLAFGLYGRNGSIGTSQVYKYDVNLDVWSQMGADISDNLGFNAERGGWIVSLNNIGTRVAIASRFTYYNGNTKQEVGRARVFEYDSIFNKWNKLGNDMSGNNTGDWFSYGISFNGDGNILAVGAPSPSTVSTNGYGYVKVYKYDTIQKDWLEYGDNTNLKSNNFNSLYGRSVALSSNGNRLAVGSILESSNGVVRVYQYLYDDENSVWKWSQIGSPISGEGSNDQFGFSLSLDSSGNNLVIGAPNNKNNSIVTGTTVVTGAVYIYSFKNDWVKTKKIPGQKLSDVTGFSNVLKGNTLIIGSPGASTNNDQKGFAEVYKFSNSSKKKLYGSLGRM